MEECEQSELFFEGIKCFFTIFALCDIGIIENVYNKNSVFESSVLLIPNFVVNLYRDHEVDQETLNNFFEANMVRFKETGLSEMNSSNFNFFVRNNLYQINERNVLDIYEKVTKMSVETFSVSELLKYDIQGLSQDINNYFDKYIELLVNKEDLYESSEVLLRILNESEVASEIKVEIIRKNNFKIHDVTEINDEELKGEVFKNEKYDITLENIMNVPGKDINLVLNHFNDSDKIQEFTLEATEVIELDENFEKILYEFMSKLVNDAGIIVHEKNIEFFKMYREYEVDGMEDRTFKMLLNVRSIQSTISNINKLTGQNKIDLMILDEKFASDNFVELSMGEEELILGIQQFKEPLLSQIINSSFQGDELIVTDSVRWLKEVLKRKFELSASKTSNLFSNEDILDSDVFVEYLVYFIPQEILSESELLAKIPTIDESLENIRIGLHGKKTANIRYYELLRVLSDKGIIGKVKIEKNKVLFWNKHS